MQMEPIAFAEDNRVGVFTTVFALEVTAKCRERVMHNAQTSHIRPWLNPHLRVRSVPPSPILLILTITTLRITSQHARKHANLSLRPQHDRHVSDSKISPLGSSVPLPSNVQFPSMTSALTSVPIISEKNSDYFSVSHAEVAQAAPAHRRKNFSLWKELPPELQSLLKRCWILGPHQAGPNLLASQQSSSSTLFDVPDKQVEHLVKKAGKLLHLKPIPCSFLTFDAFLVSRFFASPECSAT